MEMRCARQGRATSRHLDCLKVGFQTSQKMTIFGSVDVGLDTALFFVQANSLAPGREAGTRCGRATSARITEGAKRRRQRLPAYRHCLISRRLGASVLLNFRRGP